MNTRGGSNIVKRISDRIFRKTSRRSSHIGQPGFDRPEDWTHFFDKYHESCVTILSEKYPWWASEAEDAWMCAVEDIFRDPNIIKRGADDSFRSVLTNICVKWLLRKHDVHRETAVRRFFDRLSVTLQPSRNTWNPNIQKRILKIYEFVRADLLRPDYENGRYFSHLSKDKLDLWREVERSGLSDTAVSRRLGKPVKQVNRATNYINRWIFREVVKIADRHGLIERTLALD